MGKVIDYNCETKQETIREMTEQELEAQRVVDENILILEAQAEAKKIARQAVLDKLGLSADEVAALLG
jgi:predicted DNA-binding protein (UPF0251 family)